MKLLNYKSVAGAFAIAAVLTGCQADMPEPDLTVPEATMTPNTTIAELKDAFWQADTNYAILVEEKDPATQEHYIIRGRITSSDASGNIYQTMYIQDETGAIPLGLRLPSYYTEYRLGQEIVLDVTGFYIGKYAGLLQLGGYSLYNGTPQVSFTSAEWFKERVQLNGLPDPDTEYVSYGSTYPADKMYCISFNSISELPNDDAGVKAMQGQLVEFRNVSWLEPGLPLATYQATVSRSLTDGVSQLVVRTSGYSNFWNTITPEGTGIVRGELGYFNGTWQLMLRSLEDMIFDDKGTAIDPFTVAEALSPVNDGASGWVRGYIVGAVRPGVQAVTSDADIIWSNNVEADNNVVIADSPTCRDHLLCMVVELPQSTPLRTQVNLLDNPDNYGKLLAVNAKFTTLLGMGGAAGSLGTADDFLLGDAAGTPVRPADGDGSEEKPYSVADLKDMKIGVSEADVWVEGYIVGYILGNSDLTGAQFSGTMVSDDTNTDTGYNNQNILLGATAETNSLDAAIPVKLAPASTARTQLGLRSNPGAYKTHVKLKGNITTGFNVVCLDVVRTFETIN